MVADNRDYLLYPEKLYIPYIPHQYVCQQQDATDAGQDKGNGAKNEPAATATEDEKPQGR